MTIFCQHDWREGRLIFFGAFFNHAEDLNKEVKVPDDLKDQSDQKEATENREKKEEQDDDPETAVRRAEELEKKTHDELEKRRKEVASTNERNRAIEDDMNAAKDATIVGMFTPDGQPIQNETLPIDSARVATLQNEAGQQVADNAVEEKAKKELIQPESVEQGPGKNVA